MGAAHRAGPWAWQPAKPDAHASSRGRAATSGRSSGGIASAASSSRREPADRLALEAARLALPRAAECKAGRHAGRAGPGRARDRSAKPTGAQRAPRSMPSSSRDLAHQRLLGRLACFDLAAGELPQPAVAAAEPALLQQHPARAVGSARPRRPAPMSDFFHTRSPSQPFVKACSAKSLQYGELPKGRGTRV